MTMKTTLEWMNLTYDVEFVSPAFDLPTRVLMRCSNYWHPAVFPTAPKTCWTDHSNLDRNCVKQSIARGSLTTLSRSSIVPWSNPVVHALVALTLDPSVGEVHLTEQV